MQIHDWKTTIHKTPYQNTKLRHQIKHRTRVGWALRAHGWGSTAISKHHTKTPYLNTILKHHTKHHTKTPKQNTIINQHTKNNNIQRHQSKILKHQTKKQQIFKHHTYTKQTKHHTKTPYSKHHTTKTPSLITKYYTLTANTETPK